MRKIAHVDVYPTAVGMKDIFNIGTGFVGDASSAGDHVFVKITTDDGYVGWGEQRALPSWSYETTESITTTIRHVTLHRYYSDAILWISIRSITPSMTH